MKRLIVKNFGPVRSADITVGRVTMFIGEQGSGKSCLAKLISTFTWMEKALNRGDFSIQYCEQYNRLKKIFCAWQGVDTFFKSSTELEFLGSAYEFSYKDSKLKIKEAKTRLSYRVPQVMYTPAERNFLSVVNEARKVKRLPSPLITFSEDFYDASSYYKEVELPINGVTYSYSRSTKTGWLKKGSDFNIKLSISASGFQSFIPVYIVSKYLSETLGHTNLDGKSSSSVEENDNLRKKIEEFARLLIADKRVDEAMELMKAYRPDKNVCFVNIVEEPEQNLYPTSQQVLLFELMRFCNMREGSELIITTHSPYLLNSLSLAVQGYSALRKFDGTPQKEKAQSAIERKLNASVDSLVSGDEVRVYQIDEYGEVKLLPSVDGIPSDENGLNSFLGEEFNLFGDLLEIENGIFDA